MTHRRASFIYPSGGQVGTSPSLVVPSHEVRTHHARSALGIMTRISVKVKRTNFQRSGPGSKEIEHIEAAIQNHDLLGDLDWETTVGGAEEYDSGGLDIHDKVYDIRPWTHVSPFQAFLRTCSHDQPDPEQ